MPVIFRLLRLSKSFALHVMRTAALVHRSTKPSAEPSGISSAESRSYFIESFRRNVSLIVSQQLSFVKRFRHTYPSFLEMMDTRMLRPRSFIS